MLYGLPYSADHAEQRSLTSLLLLLVVLKSTYEQPPLYMGKLYATPGDRTSPTH